MAKLNAYGGSTSVVSGGKRYQLADAGRTKAEAQARAASYRRAGMNAVVKSYDVREKTYYSVYTRNK